VSTLSTSEWLARARQHQQGLESRLQDLHVRREQHDGEQQRLAQRLAVAQEELLAALLPQLDRDSVENVVARTGFLPLRQENPIAAREAERERLQARFAQIEADPGYRDRVELRDPELGTLTRALAEQEHHRAPLAAFLERASHPRLPRLLESGYGTPAYDVAWWRISYYQDWEAGDEILEKLEKTDGFPDFGAFREQYLTMAEAVQSFDAEIAPLRAEIDAGVALEQEHETVLLSLASLDERHLAQARRRLAEHLQGLPAEALAGPLGGAPELLGKRWGGLREQLAALAALCQNQIDATSTDVRNELDKLQRHIAKYQRPKNRGLRIDAAETDRRFLDRSESWRKRLQRHDRGFSSVSRFESYERGSLAGDLLWWDVFTDGRVDGSFMPAVASFHQSHPEYRYAPVGRDDGDAAVAQAGMDGSGDALGTDVS